MSSDVADVSGGAAAAEGDKAEGVRAASAKDQKAKDLRAAAAEGLSAAAEKREKVEVLDASAAEVMVTVAAQDPLRGAAAEVSTQPMSASNATSLVRHIFETLPIFVDCSSQKVVDDVITESQSEPMFKKMFCSALAETDIASPFACLRLLKWSSFLVKLNLLSAIDFLPIANAQVGFCQIIMSVKAKRRYCKRIFVSLFESSEVLRMYLDVVTSSSFRIDGSDSFLKLLVDHTVARSHLFSVYKDVLLDLYVRAVFNPNDEAPKPKVINVAFQALLSKVGPRDFGGSLCMTCLRILSNSPEIISLQAIQCLLESLSIDLSDYSTMLMPFLLNQSRLPNELNRIHAMAIIGTISQKCEKLETFTCMLDSIRGSILSCVFEKKINALGQLSRSSAIISRSTTERRSIITPLTSFLITCYKDDGVKEVKLAILSALKSWISVSSEAAEPELVSFMEIGLKEGDKELRRGYMQLLKVMCKCSDSLPKVIPLLNQLIELSKCGSLNLAGRVDVIYVLSAILEVIAVDTKATAHLEDNLWALIRQNGALFISVELLWKLSEEDCCIVLDLLKSLLVEHLSWVQKYSYTHLLLQLLMHLVCHPCWRVRRKAHKATKKVLKHSAGLTEDLFAFLINWMSLMRETKQILENRDVSMDMQQLLIPQTEILVKCLILVGSCVIGHFPKAYSKLMICCHHPCVANSNHPALVWKRLFRSLKLYKIIHIDLRNIQHVMKELMSQEGCRSNEHISEALFNSLQTLAHIAPSDKSRHGQGIERLVLATNEASIHVGNVPVMVRYQEPPSTETEQSLLVVPNGAPTPKENVQVAD